MAILLVTIPRWGEYLKISIYIASYGFKLGFNTRPANISKHGEGSDGIRTSNWVISAVQLDS